MAIRYSGDVEVRISWDSFKRVYVGKVRDPYVRWTGYAQEQDKHNPKELSVDYDGMAEVFLREAEKWAIHERRHRLMLERKKGRIIIRRVFQAPCPTGSEWPTQRKRSS
jgi:hypothetical protein